MASSAADVAVYEQGRANLVQNVGVDSDGWLFANQMILGNGVESGGVDLSSYTSWVYVELCSFYYTCDVECDCVDPGEYPVGITLELWDGDPCEAGSLSIAGTTGVFSVDVGGWAELRVDLLPGTHVPQEVWMKMTTDHEDIWASRGVIPTVGQNDEFSFTDDTDADGVTDLCVSTTSDWWGCTAENGDPCTGLESGATATMPGPVISLVPVEPPDGSGYGGAVSITGSQIDAPPGSRIWLNIFVSNWDTNLDGIPQLKTIQAQIDPGGYDNGVSPVPLAPADQACTTNADCEAAFGDFSDCGGGGIMPGKCTPGYIDADRADYVFAGRSNVFAVNLAPAGYIYGATIFSPPCMVDPGVRQYVGTLVLDIPADTEEGSFEIGLDPALSWIQDCDGDYMSYIGIEFATVNVHCDVIPPGTDCYRVDCGNAWVDFAAHPIPAGTLGEGSAEFSGVIWFGGSGGDGPSLSIDRLAEINFCGGQPQEQSVAVQVTQMDLVTCDPVEVDIDGVPELFSVSVGFSPLPVPDGTITVIKTYPNGGTFTMRYFARPALTFTKVSNPDDIFFYDITAERTALQIDSVGYGRWVHHTSIEVEPCGINFIPGIREDLGGVASVAAPPPCCDLTQGSGSGAGIGGPPPGVCKNCPAPCCLPNFTCEMINAQGQATAKIICEDPAYGNNGVSLTSTDTCDDFDNDGIADVQETNNSVECAAPTLCRTGTDPTLDDTDGDGCDDLQELVDGTLPCDPCSFSAGCVVDGDMDGDGCANANEVATACDPCLPAGGCGVADTDFADCNDNNEPDTCDVKIGGFDCDNNDKIGGRNAPATCQDFEPDLGACCSTQSGCAELTEAQCAAQTGWTWQGWCTNCPTSAVLPNVHDGVAVVHFNGAVPECSINPLQRLADCTDPPYYVDVWLTDSSQVMAHSFASTPIPAGFFATGSEPFDGVVTLEGYPEGLPSYPLYGEADTIIERLDDPFDRCDLPSTMVSAPIQVQMVELSLRSAGPITIVVSGSPQLWDAFVSVSPVSSGAGTLTAVKTHANGGTWNSSFPAWPMYTFIRQSDTLERIFDTGDQNPAWNPIVLAQQDDAPWSHDLEPERVLAGDPCTNFHPGVEDAVLAPEADCNQNGVRDLCDVETGGMADCNGNDVPDECELVDNDCNGDTIPDECNVAELDCNGNDVPDDCDIDSATSLDCNADGVPDECEPDCNANGVADQCDIDFATSEDCNANGIPDDCEPDCNGINGPDGCELLLGLSLDCQPNGRPDGCDIGSSVSTDCNTNGIPDECDIVAGREDDLNANGIPDACECLLVPEAALAESTVVDLGYGTRMRYLSFSGGSLGELEAVRVQFQFEVGGVPQTMWVQEPVAISEASGNAGSAPPTFWTAKLGCEPVLIDWALYDSVHVRSESIVPSTTYELSMAFIGCQDLAFGYSSAIAIITSKWGDLVSCEDIDCTKPPNGDANFDDIGGVVDKFKNVPGAPKKSRADVSPALPDFQVDFGDIPAVVDGFRGLPYPYTKPADPCGAGF